MAYTQIYSKRKKILYRRYYHKANRHAAWMVKTKQIPFRNVRRPWNDLWWFGANIPTPKGYKNYDSRDAP